MASLRLVSAGATVGTSMAAPPTFSTKKGTTISFGRRRPPSSSMACASSMEKAVLSSGDAAIILRRRGGVERGRREEDGVDMSGEFDIWLRDSITEIVRVIEKAPFVVRVYRGGGGEGGRGGGGGGGVTFVREKVESEEEWREMRRRWEGGRSRAPDGVMLVQLLYKGGEGVDGGNCWLQRPSTKLWGILIQGAKSECSACCLLKTCTVGFCTHFSVKRVNSFTDDTLTQLTNFWL